MDSVKEAQKYFDSLADSGLRNQASVCSTKNELAFLRRHLSSGSVLDVGCGFGRLSVPLSKEFAVTGVDVSVPMISEALSSGAAADFFVADMCSLPFEDSTFESTFCFWSSFSSLLTLKDQLAALDEMLRVTKDSSSIIVDVPDGDTVSHKLQRTLFGQGEHQRLMPNYYVGGNNIIYLHDQKSLRELADSTGCDVRFVQEIFDEDPRLIAFFTQVV